jgi:hypothetical protein
LTNYFTHPARRNELRRRAGPAPARIPAPLRAFPVKKITTVKKLTIFWQPNVRRIIVGNHDFDPALLRAKDLRELGHAVGIGMVRAPLTGARPVRAIQGARRETMANKKNKPVAKKAKKLGNKKEIAKTQTLVNVSRIG